MQNCFHKIFFLIIVLNLSLLARSGQASSDYNSARTYRFVDNDLTKAEELGMSAHKLAPNDIEIAHFLAKDVLLQLKKKDEAG